MSNIIAIAGKGGTGKTTLAALIIRALKEKLSGSILAIDADPNSNLGELLGVKGSSTIVEIIDEISKNPGQIPAGMTKDRYVDMKVQESLSEEEGFDLLSMGRPEGPGCYCFINNLLRDLIEKLMKNYDYIVIDNEAGMEHLSRRLLRRIETLFIVSDASIIGNRSAARISALTDELNIKTGERFLVLNKSKGNTASLENEIKKTGLKLKTTLPIDAEIEKFSIKNKSVFELNGNNPLVAEIKTITPCLRMGNARSAGRPHA
jgi:CO dehydrogenase maturation factor